MCDKGLNLKICEVNLTLIPKVYLLLLHCIEISHYKIWFANVHIRRFNIEENLSKNCRSMYGAGGGIGKLCHRESEEWI